jgi:hypothetical protein
MGLEFEGHEDGVIVTGFGLGLGPIEGWDEETLAWSELH